jgi:RNA polymerase sigma factor (sigma-70 family)
MTESTNEQLLERCQQTDLAAFEEFYRRHKNLIYNFLRARLGNGRDADDAFQETFLRIHRYILKFDPSKSALAWTLTIARNVAIDLQAKRARLNETLPGEVEGVANEQVSHAARAELDRILKSLSGEEQMILKARFVDGESYADLSKSLNISQANARQRVSRLIKKIKLIRWT